MSVRPSPKKRDKTPLSVPIPVPEQTAQKTMKADAFQIACMEQGVEPTKRQAASYNARRGRWMNL